MPSGEVSRSGRGPLNLPLGQSCSRMRLWTSSACKRRLFFCGNDGRWKCSTNYGSNTDGLMSGVQPIPGVCRCRAVCQTYWDRAATLAHRPVRVAGRTAKPGQAGTSCTRHCLFFARSSCRQPLALLCPPNDPTPDGLRMPNEQAQETPQCRSTPRVWLNTLGSESLSWCVWGPNIVSPIDSAKGRRTVKRS